MNIGLDMLSQADLTTTERTLAYVIGGLNTRLNGLDPLDPEYESLVEVLATALRMRRLVLEAL